jgi:hypothetical protein
LTHFKASDGTVQAANVMPHSAAAASAVAPIGMDIDAAGKMVAFGYSYCGLAGCINRSYGYLLTFADHGPANPSNPQGSSGPLSPSFARRLAHRVADGDGVKVAGAPDLTKPNGPGDACALSSPPVVVSATGVDPNLGGANVPAMIATRGVVDPPDPRPQPVPVMKPVVTLSRPRRCGSRGGSR